MQHQRPATILVVDDDPQIRALLKRALHAGGFECFSTGSPKAALETLGAASDSAVDLIILDVIMPEMWGWDFLIELRELGDETPILILSGRGQIDDRVKLLRLGADDFLAKPFSVKELLARVSAILRRAWSMPAVTVGELRIHLLEHCVELRGRNLDLSPTEFKLLRTLYEERGKVISRTELLARVWDHHFDPGTNLVQVHIARLRRKMREASSPKIETIAKQGYRLVVTGEPPFAADITESDHQPTSTAPRDSGEIETRLDSPGSSASASEPPAL